MSKTLFLSTYPPRECGIATFTRDVSDSIQRKFGSRMAPKIIAMEENSQLLRLYKNKVIAKIDESDLGSYAAAIKKINSQKNYPVLNIQHEFGIFGGDYGKNVLYLMKRINKKIVTAFHTVLESPEEDLKKIVKKIANLSEKIVVMTDKSKLVLCTDYSIPEKKIVVIPHGVPNVDSKSIKSGLKKKFDLEGKKILVTFGMLSRGKAIHKVISAMPKVIKKHPDAVYIIVGETHPKVREEEGEQYRNELVVLAKKLGVEKSIKFVNRYLSLNEIIEFLKLSDIYLAPALDKRQACSGTVSYAMGVGKAIVASDTMYNSDVLANNRGIVLEKNNSSLFAEKINFLLDNPEARKEFEKEAFVYSRKMIWSNVAIQYYNTFSEVVGREKLFSKLPRINFNHFDKLTDNFGMIQFSNYSTPDYESGYTLDDNARALGVVTKAYDSFGKNKFLKSAETFLSFIETCQMQDGLFHNIVDVNHEFVDDLGSEDSNGRAIHALGNVIQSSLPNSFKLRAKKILEKTFANEFNITSPRAQADSLIGAIYAKNIPTGAELIPKFVDSLVSKFDANTDSEWKWFEKYLTYGNSIIPEALFEASVMDKTKRAKTVAESSIDFITKTHFSGNTFVPVGQKKWFFKNKEKGVFDQQPIEAACATVTFLKAHKKTGQDNYFKNARTAFEWFLGRNSLNQMVYDDSTGGCFDGLTKTGVNMNQGAESTVGYLNARFSIDFQKGIL